MRPSSPRLAVRAILVREERLLLVNAYPGGVPDLWCAPGGGVEAGSSLPDNLMREVAEETGLSIRVGELALVNEFHEPRTGFHQVDLFFRAELVSGDPEAPWTDPAGVVIRRRFFAPDELARIWLKPALLPEVAFGPPGPVRYGTLEEMAR